MNTMVVLRVALVLFLVGFIAKIDARLNRDAITDARMDLLTSATRPFNAYAIFNSKPSNAEVCCDQCVCTGIGPVHCMCLDITEDHCHPGCESCACTLSIPGMCRCLDITDHCPPKCSSTS